MTQELQNELGYGVHLYNPETFILAVIRRHFSPVNKRKVDWQNVLHEARVALFEEDLRQGDNVPNTTTNYWWRIVAAIGVLLWEDYSIPNICMRKRRPLSLDALAADDLEAAAIYYEKQRSEPDLSTEVETREWVDHYLGLAEGVLLDNENVEQGQRDWLIFELWVNGFSPKEIAENPEISWLKNRDSVDTALRRILSSLWEFFGVNPEEHVMVVGNQPSTMPDREATGRSSNPKKNFQAWYAKPENKERHRKNARDRMRRKRAEAKKAKAQ